MQVFFFRVGGGGGGGGGLPFTDQPLVDSLSTQGIIFNWSNCH